MVSTLHFALPEPSIYTSDNENGVLFIVNIIRFFRMDKVFILIFVFIQTITSKRLFTNKWVVHIRGGHEDATKIATRHGFVFNGEV